jgi:hypothetical protein
MKKRITFFVFAVLFFINSSPGLLAQTDGMDSHQFDTTGFPQWAKDLRRGEIIAFGSFPFMYFFSNFLYDFYRWPTHGWDNRYAPWPFNSAGTIEKTQDEKKRTIGIAAGAAVVIALIDYGIMRYKRERLEKESRSLPEGTPIIILTPMYGEETE